MYGIAEGGRPPRSEPAERSITYLPIDLKRRTEHLAVEQRRSVTFIVAEAGEIWVTVDSAESPA
jgi:hypothetical protein